MHGIAGKLEFSTPYITNVIYNLYSWVILLTLGSIKLRFHFSI